MCYFSTLLKIVKQIILLSVLIIGEVSPVLSADQVVLKYSIWRESISVQDLRKLADTGQVSPSLASYLYLVKRQPEDLQKILNHPVKVDPIFLSKFLNSFLGGVLLDQVSEVIHTPQVKASRESLRGALVTTALTDGEIRLIKVLENYPTPSVEVEGDRLVEIYGLLQKTLKSPLFSIIKF